MTLRGVRPDRGLTFVPGQRILLVNGLQVWGVAMAGAHVWLAGLFRVQTPTLFGKAVALALLLASVPHLLRIMLGLSPRPPGWSPGSSNWRACRS